MVAALSGQLPRLLARARFGRGWTTAQASWTGYRRRLRSRGGSGEHLGRRVRHEVLSGWTARVLAVSLLIAMSAAPAHASRAYPEHQWLLLQLLRARIAMKPLAAAVPPAASPVAIVEVVIDGLRRFLCRSYPL